MLAGLQVILRSQTYARAEIHVEGSRLTLKTGYHVDSTVDLNIIPAYIPDCRTYVVEYRIRHSGEFEAIREEDGRIAVRSRHDPRHRIPVCWLPSSFVGRYLDRCIRMIDRKPVFLRTGTGARRGA